MLEKQDLQNIDISELKKRVSELKSKGYRLVQMNCSLFDNYELNYSFDRDLKFVNLRVVLSNTTIIVPSVSDIYFQAFLYENEMKDLFGINFSGISIDYNGKFYRTKIAKPFDVKPIKVESVVVKKEPVTDGPTDKSLPQKVDPKKNISPDKGQKK